MSASFPPPFLSLISLCFSLFFFRSFCSFLSFGFSSCLCSFCMFQVFMYLLSFFLSCFLAFFRSFFLSFFLSFFFLSVSKCLSPCTKDMTVTKSLLPLTTDRHDSDQEKNPEPLIQVKQAWQRADTEHRGPSAGTDHGSEAPGSLALMRLRGSSAVSAPAGDGFCPLGFCFAKCDKFIKFISVDSSS